MEVLYYLTIKYFEIIKIAFYKKKESTINL